MIEIETEVRKWGNSMAIILPKERVKGIKIKPGKKIRIIIPRDSVDLRKEFGSLKNILKKPTKELIKIANEGWH